MALSAETRSELLKNVSNFRLDLVKRLVNGSLILKGYEDGKMELHLHAAVRVPNGSETISGSGDGERLVCAVLRQSDALRGLKVADGEVSMFVWIRDRLKGLRPIDSIVRLIPLDYYRMFRINPDQMGHAPLLIWGQPSPEDIFAVINRELGAMLLNAGIEPSQFVDEIVERPSEGLDELADQDAKPERNLGLGWTPGERRHLVRPIARIRIRIGDEGTDHGLNFTIDQGSADFLKSCQVFFCPIKPLISAFQVRHDVHSGHGREKIPEQKTPKRHEIPMPKRSDSLRSLKKAVKARPSTPRHFSLPPLPSNTYSSTVVKHLNSGLPAQRCGTIKEKRPSPDTAQP